MAKDTLGRPAHWIDVDRVYAAAWRCVWIGLVGLGWAGPNGCSQAARTPQGAGSIKPVEDDGFAFVVDRLATEANAKSLDGTAIIVEPAVKNDDDTRTVTASRTKGIIKTTYTLQFRHGVKGWECYKADALKVVSETERTSYGLEANPIEMDQLFIWMKW